MCMNTGIYHTDSLFETFARISEIRDKIEKESNATKLKEIDEKITELLRIVSHQYLWTMPVIIVCFYVLEC
jgi:hypothetical protein